MSTHGIMRLVGDVMLLGCRVLEDADVLGSFVTSFDLLGAAVSSLKRPGLAELVDGLEETADVALICGDIESW